MVTRKINNRIASTLFLVLIAGLFIVGAGQSEPMLRLLSVSDVSPSSLTPGESDTLKFTVENKGSYDAENVVISWADPDGVILPIGAGNTKSVGTMSEGEEEKIEFDITADSSAVPGSYQIAITMTYVANNQTVEQVASVGIKVGGDTEFEVVLSSVSVGSVSLSVMNVGNSPAESVMVRLPVQKGYESTSGVAVLGKITASDYVTVPFDITVKDSSKDLEIEIVYTDTNGNRKTVSKSIELENPTINLITGASVQETGGRISTFGVLAIIVLVLGVGYYIHRRRKRNRRDEDE